MCPINYLVWSPVIGGLERKAESRERKRRGVCGTMRLLGRTERASLSRERTMDEPRADPNNACYKRCTRYVSINSRTKQEQDDIYSRVRMMPGSG